MKGRVPSECALFAINPYNEQPIRNPTVPFVIAVKGGLFSIASLHFIATPLMHADSFSFNLMHGTDYLFSFRVDMGNKRRKIKESVVRNSCVDGVWHNEERDISYFPFANGITFVATFTITSQSILVFVDKCHLVKFNYRNDVLPRNVDKLLVKGELKINEFRLEKSNTFQS